MANTCTVCDKSNAQLCKRCKSARYCSKTCQHNDWPTHKLLCTAFSEFDTSSRPTNEHLRAILFTVDDKRPRFFWLRCEWRDDEDGRYQSPKTDSFLGHDTLLKHIPIQYNPVLKRALANTLVVSYRDTFLVDGSKPNSSVAAITATKPGQYHDWRGPIIFYASMGPGMDEPVCKDLDMNDFRHVADYFLSYGYKPISTTQPTAGTKVKGVRINCLGDQKLLKRSHFEEVEVFSTDPIFSHHDTSDIADRIGLPIFTQRYSPDPRWADDDRSELFQHESPYNNQDATFLHVCCDMSPNPQKSFGWAGLQWQDSVGSTLVVRQDKKPLLRWHMEVLCKYCRDEIRPFFGHSMGEYHPETPMSKQDVLAMICRPAFVIYWAKWLDEKIEAGEYSDMPSPYDM